MNDIDPRESQSLLADIHEFDFDNSHLFFGLCFVGVRNASDTSELPWTFDAVHGKFAE